MSLAITSLPGIPIIHPGDEQTFVMTRTCPICAAQSQAALLSSPSQDIADFLLREQANWLEEISEDMYSYVLSAIPCGAVCSMTMKRMLGGAPSCSLPVNTPHMTKLMQASFFLLEKIERMTENGVVKARYPQQKPEKPGT